MKSSALQMRENTAGTYIALWISQDSCEGYVKLEVAKHWKMKIQIMQRFEHV
jgi:hypothetical protein